MEEVLVMTSAELVAAVTALLLKYQRYRSGSEPVAVTPQGFTVPYGLAIGAGALITWFLGVSLP